MNKRLQQAIVVALFGLLVVGIALFDRWSSRSQPSESNSTNKSTNSNQAHVEHSTVGDWITHDAAGFFTFWLVIVGVGQAGLFFWQLHYMRKSIADTRALALAAQAAAETAKEQVVVTKMGVIDLERAYLSIGPTAIKTDFVPQGAGAKGYYAPTDPMQVTVMLHVTNTGRTAATMKKIYGELSNILPISTTPVYGNIEPFLTDLSISAGQSAVLTPYVFSSDFLGEQYFWGYIEYTDIFKNKRTARFCSLLIPALRGDTGKYNLAGDEAWRECD